ncbi:MAG: hypothetical protein HZB66_00215 [Candidatus Aenigmarchaeota archaeon]|nr:hypothetical protein [Candidatus Aenigmarchaeota archaeon]
MKGQVFLIGAIIILIAIVLLKNLYSIYDTLEEKRWVESGDIEKKIKNIIREYGYSAGIATVQKSVNAEYLNELSVFLGNDTDIESLYIFAYANGTRYDVTVGNFLGERINATVNATNSTPASYAFGVLEDKTNLTASFVSGINGSITLTLSYTAENKIVNENIILAIANNSMVSFFDVKLKENDLWLRSKDVFNRTW